MRFLSDLSLHFGEIAFVALSRTHVPFYFTGADKADFYDHIPIIIRELIYRLNDDDASVLKANHAAWSALSKNVPAEELVKHIEFMRNLLASMVSDTRRRKGGVGDGEFLLPGFNMPKGMSCIPREST